MIAYHKRRLNVRAALGFTLIEMLISVAIGLVGLVGLVTFVRNSRESASAVDIRDDLEVARRHFRSLTSCPTTIPEMPVAAGIGCGGNAPFNHVRDRLGRSLLDAHGSTVSIYNIKGMDKFTFTPKCAGAQGHYNIMWATRADPHRSFPLFKFDQICQ